MSTFALLFSLIFTRKGEPTSHSIVALNEFKVVKQPFQSGLNRMMKPCYFTTGKTLRHASFS